MELRIGDAEREAAAGLLGDHFAQGRLDHEEYDERLDAVWSARTRADLEQLFHDLPVAVSLPPARSVQVALPHRPRFARLLVVAVLVALAVLLDAPWLLVVAIAWFLFARPRRPRRARR